MAMRPKAAEAGNYFELPEQMRRRMSAMGRMAARSLLRNPFRGFLMVLAVAFPFALSSVLLSFPLVVEEMLDTEFHVIEDYDMQVQLRRRMSAMGRMPRVFMTGCGCAEPALFLSDKAGKWQPCLHERTISGQRTSSGQAARCPLRVGWAG